MRAVVAVAILALATTACTRQDTDGYPPFARRMLDQTIKDPSELRGGGLFEVTPATVFCTYRPGFGIDLNMDLDKGQPRGTFGARTTPNCKAGSNANPVFARSQTIASRNGNATKVALTVWQGDAAIVGVAEESGGVSAEMLRELRGTVSLHFGHHIDHQPPQ